MAMSLRGYCRTVSARMDCSPAIRMTRLTTIARTGRLTNRSVSRILTILGFRSPLVVGLNLVVDQNSGAVAKLEDAGSHDLLPRLDPRKHRDLIAARGPELHKLLAHAAVCLTVRTFEILDDEYGISIGGVTDRGGGQGHGRPARSRQDF